LSITDQKLVLSVIGVKALESSDLLRDVRCS